MEAIEFFDVALEAKAEWRKKKDATTGDTALHMAARSDNIDIVKLLCEKYKARTFPGQDSGAYTSIIHYNMNIVSR